MPHGFVFDQLYVEYSKEIMLQIYNFHMIFMHVYECMSSG